MAERLKKAFPRTRFMVLLDGLYPNGPVMELCRKFHWVNDIEYAYGPNGRKRQIVHVVVCEESFRRG